MKFYDITSGAEVSQPYANLAADDYTDAPTAIRIVNDGDDIGGTLPWVIDGVDGAGRVSEQMERFATEAQALAAIPAFIQQFTPAAAAGDGR